MKNITLSADESLIERARHAAAEQHTTLNAAFRQWLEVFSGGQRRALAFDRLLKETGYVKAERKYSREDLNER